MAMKTKEGLMTQSFMLSDDDIKFIEKTRESNGLTNKSAALRQLLHNALLYQQLKEGVTGKVTKRVQAEIAQQIAHALKQD